jgi:hypothetical protein
MKPMFVIQPKQPALNAGCGAAMRGLGHGAWLGCFELASERDRQHSDEQAFFEIRPEVEIV